MADRGVQMTMRLAAEVFGILKIKETDNVLGSGVPGYITTEMSEALPNGSPMGMVRLTQLCKNIVEKLVNHIIELKAENQRLQAELDALTTEAD